MARLYGLRLGFIAAAAALCTMAITAPSSYAGGGATAATASYDYDQVIVFVAAIEHQPAFALLLAPAVDTPVARSFPAYRSRHASPRASGAAVRPTSFAGWRSGRTVRLAG